jgi:ligand-binding sensor domain-containing protein/signal transduction histidine kinase
VWQVDDGLPQNSVIAMIQTRDGYLWTGTWAGLMRFDGVRFTPVAAGLSNTHILALAEDDDGAVWIGTGGGGVARWKDGELSTVTTEDGLAHDDTRCLAIDHLGRVWVGTFDGLSIIDHGVVRTPRLVAGALPSRHISALAVHPDGRVFIGTAAGMCVARDLDVSCNGADRNTARYIEGLAIDARGRVLTSADRRGVAEWTGTSYSTSGICSAPCVTSPADPALLALPDGGFIMSRPKGVTRVDADGHAATIDGLPSGKIRALYYDREGSLWVGVDGGGLVRVRPNRVVTLGTESGLPTPIAGSIVQDSSGTIWAGSRCGPPVALAASGRFEQRLPGGITDCALSLLAARDGTLWISGTPNTLVAWKNGRARFIDLEHRFRDGSVRTLFEDRDGALWIAGSVDHIHRLLGDRLETFGQADGLDAVSVVAFAQDVSGRLFVASNARGLFVREGARFRHVGAAEGLPTRLISSLMADAHGDLWIGSADQGLYRLRGGHFDHFGTAEGLPDPVVAMTVEDRDGDIWVSSSRGISRLTRERIDLVAAGRAASLEPLLLGKADGMRSTEGSGGGFDPSGLRSRDGRLWFTTLDGLVVVDPANLQLNTSAPPVIVEYAMRDDDRRVDPRQGVVRLPAGTRSVEIAYTAFSLVAPRKTRFRYRMTGFDESWRDAGTRRSAFYTNLPPAEYRFEVMAANSDGVWSTAPASLRVIVAPSWWQRRTVQLAGLALLLSGTGWAAREVALRRARARVAELERAQALHNERARIARDLHDDIGTRLTHVGWLAGQVATTGTHADLEAVVRDTLRTMDELVWSVNARHDTAEGLASFAMRHAESVTRAAGFRCRFVAPPDLGAYLLASDTRRHLFLAFKEAVNNALKHSGGSTLRITFAVEGPVLMIEVRDDGAGLPASAGAGHGNGLRNMRERMAAAAGSFELLRAEGGGTIVRLRAGLLR